MSARTVTLPQRKLWSDRPADFRSPIWEDMYQAWLGQALPLHVKAHQPDAGLWGHVHVRTHAIGFRFCEAGVDGTHELSGEVTAHSFEQAMTELVSATWELLLWGVRSSWRPLTWVDTLPREVEPIARRVLPELFGWPDEEAR